MCVSTSTSSGVFFSRFYNTNSRQVLCVTGYGWLVVCLYAPSRHFVALYICTGFIIVWVRVQARSELHSSRIAWLAGWLVAVWVFAWVCVWHSLANRHASNRNSKNYDMRLVDCELLCRNHTYCMSVCMFFSLIDPKWKLGNKGIKQKTYRRTRSDEIFVNQVERTYTLLEISLPRRQRNSNFIWWKILWFFSC